jgi:sugar O-acyltransferase (sialic acid O-acetyltransferase NeuD family)
MDNKLAIIGSGGHARSIIGSMRMDDLNRLMGYIDLNENQSGLERLNYLGDDSSFTENYCPTTTDLILGLSYLGKTIDLSLRTNIINFYLSESYKFHTVISEKAIIASNSHIGSGTFISPGVIINNEAYLGDFSSINTGAIIEHNVKIGFNVQISSGAIICGGVKIGDHSFIGAGVIIRDGISIPENTIIGIGSLVLKDIESSGVYLGNPLKKIN